MGVVAVACVAVMNGQALGPMGRLHHHKEDRASARNQHVAGMGFFDEEAPSGAPGLTFSNAQLGLARLLRFPKFAADEPDDGPDAPAPANIGFGRPASGVGVVSRQQAASTPSPNKPQADQPPQDQPPQDPPGRAASPLAPPWVDAALTPDKPAPPPVTPDPPPVVVVTPVVVITPPVLPPPPDRPPPVSPAIRLAAAPPAPPAPVPEPATWMMMVLGFGAVAAALRRRRLGAGQGWPTEHGPAL
jgi:hypothetical protein